VSLPTPPNFYGLATFCCKANRLYRIYLRPDEMIFIWAGKGGEGVAGALAVAKGGHGPKAAMGEALARWLDPTDVNQARLEVLERTTLEELLDDHPLNLRAPLAGFEEVRIRARSDFHARAFSDHGHQALLHLRHRSLGKLRLGLAMVEDVKVAISELPRFLRARGVAVRIETTAPEVEQPCGCVFCRRNRGEVMLP